MFFSLFWKELKWLFKGIPFYLFAGIVVLFYITQYGGSVPVVVDKPIQPLSEMQFMYGKLLDDYRDGKLTNRLIKEAYAVTAADRDPESAKEEKARYEKANDYALDQDKKAAIRETIRKMNPDAFRKSENILDIRFQVTYEEYLDLMRKLDASLGGHTYYWDKIAKQSLLASENSYGTTEVTDRLQSMKNAYLEIRTAWATSNVRSTMAGMTYFKPVEKDQRLLLEDALNKILPDGLEKIAKEEDPSFHVSYEEFLDLVRNLDAKLGVNQFEEALTGEPVFRELTYEEAIQSFKQLFGRDKLSNAYARCLADYMGITAGFLPIFLAAFLLIRDYRSGMAELIFSRKISSLSYIFSKFAAVSSAVMLCYLGIAAHSTFVFAEMSGIYGYDIDPLAFFKYILAWVTPTVLFTSAMGILLSLLFRNGFMAVAAQFVLWAVSVTPLGGDYRLFKCFIRFNTVAGYEQYESWFPAILANRVFFTLLSVGMVAAASAVLARRRSSGCGMILNQSKGRGILYGKTKNQKA